MIYSSIGLNQLISKITNKEIRRYKDSCQSLCNWLSHDLYFVQKVMILSVIISLGGLKPNATNQKN